MSRSDHSRAGLSTFKFPDELRVDELLLRGPQEADIATVAPAFSTRRMVKEYTTRLYMPAAAVSKD